MSNKSKQNILLVSGNGYLTNGSSIAFLDLAYHLKDKYNLFAIVDKNGELANALRKLNIKVIIKKQHARIWNTSLDTKTNKNIKFYLKSLIWCFLKSYHTFFDSRLLLKYKIQLVHINTSTIGFIAYGAKKAKVPYVWHFREILNGTNTPIQFLKDKESYELINNSRSIIYISNAIKNNHKELIHNKNQAVVYDGLNIKKFYKERAILNNTPIKVLSCGRMHPQKGHYQVVKTVNKLNQQNKIFKLDIAGYNEDKGYTKMILEYIKANKLENCVNYKGYVKYPEKLYKEYDIYINNGYNEGFGLTTIEAMQSGCLVLANNSGSSGEIISQNKTGLLFNSNDESAIFDLLNSIFKKKSTYQNIAKKGQIDALKFNIEQTCNNIMSIYDSILN